MFRQFTEGLSGNQIYLLFSLAIFLIFFVVVGLLLLVQKNEHILKMKNLPLQDGTQASN